MKHPKVFCIGFQKTGTTSLNRALGLLGYRVASAYGRDLPLETLERSWRDRGMALLETHDAVEDMPWPLMFRELDAAFPGAKFVFTSRASDRWIASIREHFGPRPNAMQQLIYGRDAPSPVGCEARYVEVFEAHNAAVRAHFHDRPDAFIEMDLSAGDGWEKLCAFLGEPIPDAPFPMANTGAARRTLSSRVRRRLKKWGLIGPRRPAAGHPSRGR